MVSNSARVQVAVASVVLLSMPLLGVALSPPGWLRRVWREYEEVQLRNALNNLLLFSPDEETLAGRALEWAARLLGGGAALLALDGRVLAVSGMTPRQATACTASSRGCATRQASRSPARRGLPLWCRSTPRRGRDTSRCSPGHSRHCSATRSCHVSRQYAVSITVAMDRVHLVTGMRRNAELLDLAYDAVFSWNFDTRAHRIREPAAAQLYGYTQEEADRP